jgi:hypothetical protein
MLIDLFRINKTTFVNPHSKMRTRRGGFKLKFTFCFMEAIHEPLHLAVRRSMLQYRSWTHLQVLFERLFCATAVVSNVTIVGDFEVMLGQTLNHSV